MHGSSKSLLNSNSGAIANMMENSAKRMYFPQAYHHVQEIQKYNIQDYRPRYVSFAPFMTNSGLTTILGWNSFRKQSAKSDKFSACGSNAATHFRRRTKVKHAFYKLTIQRGNEEDMERWLVRGRIDSI